MKDEALDAEISELRARVAQLKAEKEAAEGDRRRAYIAGFFRPDHIEPTPENAEAAWDNYCNVGDVSRLP